MTKYSLEFKLEVVESVLKQKWSMHEAANRYDLATVDVQKWLSLYRQHGTEGLSPKQHFYDGSYKQAIVEDMCQNGLSYM